MKNYRISIDVSVTAPEQLHAGAHRKLIAQGIDADDALTYIGAAHSPNLSACLTTLVDPGLLAGAAVLDTTVNELAEICDINAAKERFVDGSDDIQIDPVAPCADGESGVWIGAWVLVPRDTAATPAAPAVATKER